MKAEADVLAAAVRLAELLQACPSHQAVWSSLDSVLSEVFGHRLFTVLVHDDRHGRLLRVHSSRPEVNPMGGAKTVQPSAWTTRVLIEGAPYIGRNRAHLREVFFDYEALWAIGCESVMNIPVRCEGKTIGSLNLLDGPGAYGVSDVPLAKLFAQLVVPALHDEYARLTAFDRLNL